MSALVLVAITHHRAPIALLERVALHAPAARSLERSLNELDGVAESAVLSTCNRTELYLHGTEPDADAALRQLLQSTGAPADPILAAAQVSRSESAERHLFRVAGGLESRIVGDAQILGQVRGAIAAASATGSAGPQLSSLFRFAISAGRRVRRSGLDRSPSLAELATHTAVPPDGHDEGRPASALIVGSGEMSAALARELAQRRVAYRVCARSVDRARRLSRRPVDALPIEALPAALLTTDVVLLATSASVPLLGATDLSTAMAVRAGRPLTIVDLSLPRNVDPRARSVPGVRLIDLDGVRASTADHDRRRADEIITEEHQRYRLWQAGQRNGARIVAMRDHVLASVRFDARHAPSWAGLATEERAARARAARLLHETIMTVKRLAASGQDREAEAFVAAFLDSRQFSLTSDLAPALP